MRTRRLSETYEILVNDENGLIPREALSVTIHYSGGRAEELHYNPHRAASEEESTELYLKTPRTEKGIEEVIALLKDSSID